MSSLLSDDDFFVLGRTVVVGASVVEVVELDVLVLVLVELVLVLVELVVVAGAVVVVAGGAVVGGAGPSTVKSVDASSPFELWARMMAAPTTEHWVVRVAVHAGGTGSAPENVAAPLESAVPRVVTLAPWMKSMVMHGTDWSL